MARTTLVAEVPIGAAPKSILMTSSPRVLSRGVGAEDARMTEEREAERARDCCCDLGFGAGAESAICYTIIES